MTKRDKRPTKEEQPAAQAADREQPDKPNLSEDERREILQFAERKRNRRRAPRLQVVSKPGKPLVINFGSPVERTRLMSAFGTSELAHTELMFSGIVNAACDGSGENPPSERDINRVLAAVTGIGASDETEGMLATQMVATHAASITTLRRLKDSQTLLERDRYGSLAVKLLRAFAAQVEALQRYRGKGQQKVTVEHVHVHAGGQAIVGAVTREEGARSNRLNKRMHHQKLPMNRALRCGAKTRSGKPCRSPVVRGKRRCRMHGGAAGSGAPVGNKNAFRHGHYSAEAIARRRQLSELIRIARDTLAELK